MAKRVVHQLIDDIDNKVIDEESGEHITFSVNGQSYEIDLNSKNAKEFHRKLDYYIVHATRVGGQRGRKPVQANSSVTVGTAKRDAHQTKAIREWALSKGYEISSRGRIPAEVESAFSAAH